MYFCVIFLRIAHCLGIDILWWVRKTRIFIYVIAHIKSTQWFGHDFDIIYQVDWFWKIPFEVYGIRREKVIILGALLPLWGVNFICKSSLLHSYYNVFIRITRHVTQPLSWEVLRDEPFPVCKEVLSRRFSRIAITRLLTLGHEKCRSFLSLYCNNLKSAFHTSVLPVKVPLHLYPWPHNFKYLQLYFFKSFFATRRLFWTLEEISDIQFLTVMMIPRRSV